MVRFQQIQFSRMTWRGRVGLAIGIALALALAIALIVLAFGLALILLPIVAIGLLIGRWRFNKLMAEARARDDRREDQRPGGARRIIDTEYTVIDERDRR